MKIGINLTTFNRLEFSEQCLKSLLWSKPQETVISIVDNGSTDGTKEMILDYQNTYPSIKHVVLNKENLYIGAAIRQGWSLLSEDCPLLCCINNDYLMEPGWDINARACFDEMGIDYLVGSIRFDIEHKKQITPSGNGHYVLTKDAGAGYFIKREHFLNGYYPSTRPFSAKYVGPGPSWHKRLKRNLIGFRLASPGVVVRKSEYNKPEYVEYYNKTFGIRARQAQLVRFRQLEDSTRPRGWMNWQEFLQKHYPEKVK